MKCGTIILTSSTVSVDNFSLFSDDDGYTSAFETGISRSALVAGYYSELIPDGATTIRVKSNTAYCTNYVDVVIVSPTPTPSITPSITPTVTPTISITPSVTPSSTPPVSPSVTPTISVTPSITPTSTPDPSPSVTPTISVTPSPTSSPAVSPSPTPSSSPTTRAAIAQVSSGFGSGAAACGEPNAVLDTYYLTAGYSDPQVGITLYLAPTGTGTFVGAGAGTYYKFRLSDAPNTEYALQVSAAGEILSPVFLC